MHSDCLRFHTRSRPSLRPTTLSAARLPITFSTPTTARRILLFDFAEATLVLSSESPLILRVEFVMGNSDTLQGSRSLHRTSSRPLLDGSTMSMGPLLHFSAVGRGLKRAAMVVSRA